MPATDDCLKWCIIFVPFVGSDNKSLYETVLTSSMMPHDVNLGFIDEQSVLVQENGGCSQTRSKLPVMTKTYEAMQFPLSTTVTS